MADPTPSDVGLVIAILAWIIREIMPYVRKRNGNGNGGDLASLRSELLTHIKEDVKAHELLAEHRVKIEQQGKEIESVRRHLHDLKDTLPEKIAGVLPGLLRQQK